MEEIRKFVEDLIQMAGVTGGAVPVVRHILLTITAILLAMLSDLLCRRLLVPIIMKVTDKTEVTWDSCLGHFSAASSEAPLLPKLRGHFAEFLNNTSPAGLRILSSSTCVGLRYGRIYHNSGFSRQLAHTLPYSCSVRVTSSD